MHTSSKWILLLLWQQWFHGHVQTQLVFRLIQPHDSNGDYFEGFVHTLTLIWLGSLRRVLAQCHSVAWEANYRCWLNCGSELWSLRGASLPWQGLHVLSHNQDVPWRYCVGSACYRKKNTRKLVNYHGSNANYWEIIQAKDPLQISSIFRSENVAHSQGTPMLASADVNQLITFACVIAFEYVWELPCSSWLTPRHNVLCQVHY